MVKVSIITAVYNRESTIERCVRSVLSQKYQNIEYIIVDGLSTDGTLDVLRKFEGQITKLVSEKDLGIYDALNKGLSMATGDVIGFLHSDDYYANDSVVDTIAGALDSNDCDLIYADLDFFYQNTPRLNWWDLGLGLGGMALLAYVISRGKWDTSSGQVLGARP